MAQVAKWCKTAAVGSVCNAATDFSHQNAWGQKEINAETQQKQWVWTMTEQFIYQRPFHINTFLHTHASPWIWKLWKQAWRLCVDQNALLNTQLFVKQIKKWSRRTSAWGKMRENKDLPTNTHTHTHHLEIWHMYCDRWCVFESPNKDIGDQHSVVLPHGPV